MKKSDKSIPKELFVHIERAGELCLIGKLRLEDEPFGASFKYDASWLESAHGFAIDPLNLPLSVREFATSNKYLVLGSLFDSAPDLWGRRLLATNHGLDEPPTDEGGILLLGQGNGVGALLYSSERQLDKSMLPSIDSLPLIERDLCRVHQAAFDIINGKYSSVKDIEFEDGHLLAGSSAIGGARAKAVVRDANNALWIAKFAEPNADFDRQRMEYANLKMAQDIGLEIPEISIADTDLGSVLLIKRFDRATNNERLHYISAISLISHTYQDKRAPTTVDKAKFSYAAIADVIGKVCVNPTHDRQKIFAQMILNFMIKNTDDHLKNFGFIEASGTTSPTRRLRLSPAFDIVTQPTSTHYLFTSFDGFKGDVDNAIQNARSFGLTKHGASEIVDRVRSIAEQRNTFYQEAGLSEKEMAHINRMIGARCSLAKVPVRQMDEVSAYEMGAIDVRVSEDVSWFEEAALRREILVFEYRNGGDEWEVFPEELKEQIEAFNKMQEKEKSAALEKIRGEIRERYIANPEALEQKTIWEEAISHNRSQTRDDGIEL